MQYSIASGLELAATYSVADNTDSFLLIFSAVVLGFIAIAQANPDIAALIYRL
jgi:hypothetical protein